MLFKELSEKHQNEVIRRYRKINLTDGWDKPTSDHWAKHLAHRGIIVTMFHYKGFYKRGNGGSFDAEIDLVKFISKDNVKRMIKAGIDIMFIRKVRQMRDHHDYTQANLTLPRFKIFRSRNAKTFNPLSMDVTWHGFNTSTQMPKIPGVDDYTVKMTAEYLKKRCRYYATRYYLDLKKVYDKRIDKEAVAKKIMERGWKFTIDGAKEGGEINLEKGVVK